MNFACLLPAMCVGLLNLTHTASEAFLCFRAHLAQAHTQLLVVGSQRPHFLSLSLIGREEHVLGRYSYLDVVPQNRYKVLGSQEQTQGTDSASLPLSLLTFGVSENWRNLLLMMWQ